VTSDLVAHLARFGGALRAEGVRVSVGDEEDALRALLRVDVGDRAELREALRCTLKIRPRDGERFEGLFDELWGGAPRNARAARPAAPAGATNPGVAAAWSALGLAPEAAAGEEAEGDEPGWSRAALLRHKPFERCDGRDLAEMERLLARLAARLATRRSRRLAPALRGAADLRRSLRRAFSTGGEMIVLARRARPVEAPRLVLLLDTSGSMDAHARFLLAFARALKRVAPRTEVFALNTELVRVTAWLSSGQQDRALARLAEAVPDWSGGTRLGECLAEFAERHLAALVDARTAVVVLSDGLDRGDPALVGDAMARIHARAGHVLWLNPLLGDARYEPIARGMAAALPHVDRLEPAHDLASLERLLPHLAS
jgi:uncharacterized protein with von Willebrand factor type A (vWA) domain